MINEIINMNVYGLYVWSSFIFTLVSFGFLYVVTKLNLIKEKIKLYQQISKKRTERY